jgi:hypothetical protein
MRQINQDWNKSGLEMEQSEKLCWELWLFSCPCFTSDFCAREKHLATEKGGMNTGLGSKLGGRGNPQVCKMHSDLQIGLHHFLGK